MATSPLPTDFNPAFTSRRSPVLCRNGCVASSQPLASYVGVDILRRAGANAADAAVAVAAALCVLEPFNAGLGGDMFCLYYNAVDRKVSVINGSGKSPLGLTREIVRRDCPNGNGGISPEAFKHSQHAVTVPGLAQGLDDLFTRHGSGNFSFSELVEPAAKLAEDGFPVTPTTAQHWKSSLPVLERWIFGNGTVPFSVDGGRSPRVGEIFSNPELAHVLRELGAKGSKKGFYSGEPGRAIVQAVQRHGGMLTQEDLDHHTSLFPEPLCAEYRGVKLWQIPPNGQGIAALVALTGLAHLEENGVCEKLSTTNMDEDSTDVYHAQIEMMRLGFAETRPHIACPDHNSSPFDYNEDRIRRQAERIFDPQQTAFSDGKPQTSSCTVSFQVVDSSGNAVSFLNSNFNRTGIVPDNCGFILQNRGFSFSLLETGPNAIAGGKRPFNTMIAGMLTHADTDELYATISNIGGYMQPQGHLQLTVDMVAGGLDPQAAIDKPRFCITDDGTVLLEEGVDNSIVQGLIAKGHKIKANISGGNRGRYFGHAQIIKRERKTRVLWAGSDGRTDGCAIGY